MKRKLSALFVFALLTFVLVSCEKEPVILGSSDGVKGSIQKGPFVTGSNVMVQLLDGNFTPSGVIYSVITNNDFGGFDIENEIKSPYIEVITTGFYFDEVKGHISDAQISLRSLSQVDKTGETNVNILTTLSNERIVYLFRNAHLSYEDAKIQAQNEILSIFNIPNNDAINFDRLNISQGGEENAILLAISCVLQGNLTVGQLSEMVYKFILDIKEDGVLNDYGIKSTLSANAGSLDLASIRSNLESRYREIGYNAVIPPFEKYAKRLVPLNIIKTYPENGVKFAYGAEKIQLYFNKGIDVSTVNSENITVVNSSGTALTNQLSYDENQFMITIDPTEEMLNNETYTIRLTTGVTGIDKEQFTDYSFSFKTFSVELENGLRAYYTFTGNANDATGNNFNATAYNGDYEQYDGGEAYYLRGRGSYIEVPNVINIGNSNWSYSIWVNYKSLDRNVHSLLLGTTYSLDGFNPIPLSIQNVDRLTGMDNRVIDSYFDFGRLTATIPCSLIDTWNMFTVVIANNYCQIYLNGIEVGKTNETIEFLPEYGSYYISQSPNMFNYGPLAYLDALVDNVRFYNRALNKKEVYELYQGKK